VIHYINLRVIAHSTEDQSRVLKALDFLLSDIRGDSSINDFVETLDVDGHYGNSITIFSGQITRKSDSKAIVDIIRANMSDDDILRLRDEMPERLDDDQVFHLRIDKQAAFNEMVKLTSSADAITIKVKIATYPKDRRQAGLIVEELFG
jgi:RNA binding exosome subunit